METERFLHGSQLRMHSAAISEHRIASSSLVLSILANKLIDQSEELEVLFCESVSMHLCYTFVYDTKQTEIKQASHAPKFFD